MPYTSSFNKRQKGTYHSPKQAASVFKKTALLCAKLREALKAANDVLTLTEFLIEEDFVAMGSADLPSKYDSR